MNWPEELWFLLKGEIDTLSLGTHHVTLAVLAGITLLLSTLCFKPGTLCAHVHVCSCTCNTWYRCRWNMLTCSQLSNPAGILETG